MSGPRPVNPTFPWLAIPVETPEPEVAPVATAGAGEHRHGRHAMGKLADRLHKYGDHTPAEAEQLARESAQRAL